MPRNAGSTIDTDRRAVCDRDGVWYPFDELIVDGNALYYARPLNISGLSFHYHRRWLLLDQQWSISQLVFDAGAPDAIDWYIEPDAITRDGARWRVRDAYLDVSVYEGQRYRLEDAGELAEGLLLGEITVAEAAAALIALDALCAALRTNGCLGAALLRDFAPSLPQPAGAAR